MEYCVCTWCLKEHHSCCRQNFWKDLVCHIDLGRGHLFFEKLGVRAVVTSKQSPHLLLPLTSFGPQGHEIPVEIEPRISSDECAISMQNEMPLWFASTSDRMPTETDNVDTDPQHSTDEQGQNPCDEERDFWENRSGRWVRVRGIARRTLFDPMHDDQPLCQKPTERRRTTVRFHGCDAKPLDRDRRVVDTKYAKGRHLGTQQTSQQSRTALSQPFESDNRCNAILHL